MVSSALATAAQADIGSKHFATSAEESAEKRNVGRERILRELDSFKTSPVSLRAALATAQERRAGWRIVDISFDGTADRRVYRVKMNRGDRIWQDTIDAVTGDVVGAGDESSVANLPQSDRHLIARLRNVHHDMLDAIIVAERNTSGKAVSAGLAMDHGRFQFVIVCVVGSDLKQFVLEPPRAAVGPPR